MYNKVEICGVNTATLKVLTEKEKTALLLRIRDGDKAARDEMVNGNLRLVLSVVQRFTGRGENLDDLFQVGCIGLVKSIDNFDIRQNVRFSTYAVPMVLEGGNNIIIGFITSKNTVNTALLDVFFIYEITFQFQININVVVFINNNTFDKFAANCLFFFFSHTWKSIFKIFQQFSCSVNFNLNCLFLFFSFYLSAN